MLFGIQIVFFNIFLICLLGDKCEHGCYHLNSFPPYCIVNEEGACRLCPDENNSIMRILLLFLCGGAGGESSDKNLQSGGVKGEMLIKAPCANLLEKSWHPSAVLFFHLAVSSATLTSIRSWEPLVCGRER